jgi:hypothetical protein
MGGRRQTAGPGWRTAARLSISGDLKDKTDAERSRILATMMRQLAKRAKGPGASAVLENLDFPTKKLTMLSALVSSQCAELMTCTCEKLHIKLYKVNPSYRLLSGYMKYGRLNRRNGDEAVAH